MMTHGGPEADVRVTDVTGDVLVSLPHVDQMLSRVWVDEPLGVRSPEVEIDTGDVTLPHERFLLELIAVTN